jgi:inhibitor of cysteine peptidase
MDSEGFSFNNVFFLDFNLKIIGSVRKIAVNLTILSARYMDTRLYLVTSRRINPFLVIDLSNHKLPKVLGELKITGFSNYLHPYDNRTIIGLARETNAAGQQTWLKVSLFDVSNVLKPQSLARYILPIQYAYLSA